MKKLMILTAFALCGLSLVADSAAFTYQARLKESTGELSVTNANLAVEIRLYKSANGNDVLWGRLFNVLTDAQGNFNLLVSDDGSVLNGTPETAKLADVMKAQQAGDLYLGLTVANQTKGGQTADEIKPRQRIFAVPFAAVANDVRAISGDVTVGGQIRFGTDTDGVIISKDGIEQKSTGTRATEVKYLSVLETATVTTLDAGKGVLKVDADSIKVTKDVAVTNGNVAVTNGNVAVTNGNVAVTNGNVAVTNGTVKVNGSELLPVPVGGIIMWSKATPPDANDWASSPHWAICDGQNGTPNLTDRFIVAASPAGTGGKYQLNDQGGLDTVTLTEKQMPSHTHQHKVMTTAWAAPGGGGGVCAWIIGPGIPESVTGATGGGQAHENRPPYYALYYIMRVK